MKVTKTGFLLQLLLPRFFSRLKFILIPRFFLVSGFILISICQTLTGCGTGLFARNDVLTPEQHIAKANLYLRQASEAHYPNSVEYRLLAAENFSKAGKSKEASDILSDLLKVEQNMDNSIQNSIFEARLALLKNENLRAERLIKVAQKSHTQNTSQFAALDSSNAVNGKKIALLLPSKGPHAKAAKTIRDGFMAAYYKTLSHQPSDTGVQVYDTSGAGGVTEAYQKAIQDNVGLIVGPLTKPEVQEIANIPRDVPVLALNTLPNQNSNQGKGSHHFRHARLSGFSAEQRSKLYQFGLMPEDEVFAVAQLARRHGKGRAIIIAPKSEWGDRMAHAFSESFEFSGGMIVSHLMLSENDDLSAKIRSVLEMQGSASTANSGPDSKLQKESLKSPQKKRTKRKSNEDDADDLEVGDSNASHPYLGRRQDIDMIFLAASPEMGREIKPLINYYKADNIPVYATASIYTGSPTPTKDLILDNVRFCDMPWLLGNSNDLRETRQKVAELWPASMKISPRYFALGMDAYNIASQITERSIPISGSMSGVTGDLQVNREQHIQRRLVCAKFENGVPVPE